MLTNRQIAKNINFLGKLMELHGENSFKTKAYYSAYNTLRKVEEPFSELSDNELLSMPSVGKIIVDKIREFLDTGTQSALERYKDMTPLGIQQMLSIRGIGPKKVMVIWKEMEIEEIGDLLYACNENRLVNFKGFGLKTQESIKENLEYFIASQGLFHYANVVDEAIELLEIMISSYPDGAHELVGDIARKMPEVRGIEIITTEYDYDLDTLNVFPDEENGELKYKGYPVFIDPVDPDMFGTEMFMRTASNDFIKASGVTYDDAFAYEEDLLDAFDMTFVPYEYREKSIAYQQSISDNLPTLIDDKDIKGVVHNHSTYSDGLHSVEQMALRCMDLGYQYFVICDHSRTAFYANGLSIEHVEKQWREIDALNAKYPDFKIYKGIESDILNDGSLDYPDDILAGFDVVVTSIHGNLKMDIDKANSRLIKAIENPYTHILGHPTGRLLLGRTGYPIDHKLIIEAAAANSVSIELNANPQRLDMDWKWIDYAMDRGVLISINPDAHSMDQISYIKYGVAAARKGGLTADMCLNSKTKDQFKQWLDSKVR